MSILWGLMLLLAVWAWWVNRKKTLEDKRGLLGLLVWKLDVPAAVEGALTASKTAALFAPQLDAALANDPKLLLADEPTGDLDTKTKERVR